MKIRKGDRVETTAGNGKILYGTVTRGGKIVTAVLDGGREQVKGPASAFRPTDKPLPVSPPSVMDKWGGKSCREISGHGDTPTFSAEITLNGKVVGKAMNGGYGGPDDYHFRDRALRECFLSDCGQWAEQFSPGSRKIIEPDSVWLDWYVFDRPFGRTAEACLADLAEELDRLSE